MQRFAICLIFALLLPAMLSGETPCTLETIEGKVIGATNGDTIGVLSPKEMIKVRLEGIDAPEEGKSFGHKARDHIKELLLNKQVTVNKTGIDKYGRTLGFVYLGSTDVNARMIEDGYAWQFKLYNTEERLATLESEARESKRGLWADERPISPWENRRRQNLPDEKLDNESPHLVAKDEPKEESKPVAKKPTTAKPQGSSIAETRRSATEEAARNRELVQQALRSQAEQQEQGEGYWLNSKSGVRQNAWCQHYGNTQSGRSCSKGEGRAWGICRG